MSSLYVDPNRLKGSQSEDPAFRYERNLICFDGYQRFCLAPNTIRFGKQVHRRKYTIVRPYLFSVADASTTIMDLGCSAGVMGFQAYLDGFKHITFVDHDPEYLHLVRAGMQHIGATKPVVEHSKVHEVSSTADVLFAFAIIHWLYSCTEDFGSLERIVDKLSLHCRKTMFIEWIGPECKDVQLFGHIECNPDFHKDRYNRENFIKALEGTFPFVKRIGQVQKGREIWVASHHKCLPSLISVVRERVAFWAWAIGTKALNWPFYGNR